jgi:DNA-binding SARP family transcriptional activator
MLRLHLFGTIALVSEEGEDLLPQFQQTKRLGLLAYLAAAPERFHRRDTLTGLFWPDLDDQRARNALRQALHYLRSHLSPDLLASRGEDVALRDDLLWCDTRAFELAVASARHGEALGYYRGEFMPGFHLGRAGTVDFEEWISAARRRFKRLARQAAAAQSEAAAGTGDLAAAAREATQALDLATLDEPLTRRVMELLEAAGDRAGALRIYESFRHRLETELGAGPSPTTRALAEKLRAPGSG